MTTDIGKWIAVQESPGLISDTWWLLVSPTSVVRGRVYGYTLAEQIITELNSGEEKQ